MREPNAIDYWRGLALVMIFIDHVPGNVFAFYTMRSFAISDAAELFVFLAGWSLSYATGGPLKPERRGRTVLRLVSRAIELYRAQLTITLLALALLAGAAIAANNPIFLEWHNAGPAFYDPIRATIGNVLLTYQLGYFNILPLYIVLLLIAPLFIILARWHALAALGLSVSVYAFALVTRTEPPSWPTEERWYFNPLSWQLLLVMGFLGAESVRASDAFGALMVRLLPYAAGFAAFGAIVTLVGFYPDPLEVPEPRAVFTFDKTFLSPVRVLNLLALAIAFQKVFALLCMRFQPVTSLLCALGRNSLAVFCVASLLALAGQIIRFFVEGSFIVDLAIVTCGIGLMGFTAWFVEWRSRSPSLALPRSS